MSLNSYDEILAAINAGQTANPVFLKNGSTAQAAGIFTSLWTGAGFPGAGVNPPATPGTIYNSDSGGLTIQDTSTLLKYLLSSEVVSTQLGTLILYDRLVGVGGISLVGTGSKIVNTQALPRYTNGLGVVPALEVTAATATTATVIRLNTYTNQSGITGRIGTNFTFPGAITVLNSLFFLPLQSGDSNVRSVQSLEVITAPTVGTVNLVLLKILSFIPLAANLGTLTDYIFQVTQMERLYDGATLGLAFLPGVTTAPTITGKINSAWG